MFRLEFFDDLGQLVCYYKSQNLKELEAYASGLKVKSKITKEKQNEH
jgi:hypothetical protein